MDNGSFTALVSLDISAAYDTIDHSVLSSRLQSDVSIDGKALAWIPSYLATDIRSCRWAAQPLVNNHASLVLHRAA